MSKIRRQFDSSYKGSKGKEFKGKSMAVPDLNLSVRELLVNHSRGILDLQAKEEVYLGDEEIPKFTDMAERWEYIQDLQDQEQEIKDEIERVKLEAEQTRQKEMDELKKENQKLTEVESLKTKEDEKLSEAP